MRTPIIVGNWKMNMTVSEAEKFAKEIKEIELDESVEKGICAPAIDLSTLKSILKDTDIKLGAENMYFEKSGAFTGEISPEMLKDLDLDYVILGHSERREIFKEDDELINKKLKSALEYNLTPIVCVGESLDERENNKAYDKVKMQIEKAFDGISKDDVSKVVIAYEPIWAIGTGKTASAEDADDMCKYIRELIGSLYSENEQEAIRIQYGGSVKPENVVELMNKENIDGGLIGGASLKVESFKKLVNYKGE